MTIEEINNIACQIIAHAGDGKSYSMEAIENAETGDFKSAEENLKCSDESIRKAHEIHTDLLVQEAREPGCVTATMMLIHASNHLSTAELTRDLAERFVRVYKNVQK
ncbi:PTS lactose/cellobiose transporter subunit IIA [Traorella massiliensis]|uniref:PTS lactose/cellobiose transporter subunit IIA n=1 Tax=Traorella massiliensis TaxID=1903263 RepID=UPI0023569B66|nr:PTS lactose/cellobiose transporter subunit IIA [Traorella massiliensis]